MHYREAVNLVTWRTSERLLDLPYKPKIDFVSPVVATVCAAWTLKNPKSHAIEVNGQCKGYADVTGLSEALLGHEPIGQPSSLHGATYSRLTRLFSHYEVDSCNSVISDVLYSNLDQAIANPIASVVGELHDNVASHASGTGFSAAQVYCTANGQTLELSVTDGGCGMLCNVQKVCSDIVTHPEAIDWCLERGNTTAMRPLTGMEQRLPADYQFDPYPKGVGVVETEMTHHVGLGMWKVTELIRKSAGQLWIWSGDAQIVLRSDGSRSVNVTDTRWDGLAIEIWIDLDRARSLAAEPSWQADMSEFAKRIGL